MRCPKCQASFESVTTQAGIVDRCTGCQGLWFDLLEHEDLKDFAQQVDTGCEKTGRRYNQVDRIDCPVCPSSRLTRMVDRAQPHIWFESCPTCHGRFYDAGEFRDFAELTLVDRLKRLFVRERR